MNTIFALFFILTMQDGSVQYKWASTYTSQKECVTEGKKITNVVIDKLTKKKNHGIDNIVGACVPQHGA